MEPIVLAPWCIRQREIDLFPFLAKCNGLFLDRIVANELGMQGDAFRALLAAGLFPDPRPAWISEEFWFDQPTAYWLWVWLSRWASSDELHIIVDLIHRYDENDGFSHLDHTNPRTFILDVMEQNRGGREHSELLSIKFA